MNYAVHKISLDIHKPESQVVLNVKQTDTGRKIKISLTEDGRPYVLTSDCLAIFKAKTPDGNDIKADCAIDGNTIIYTVSSGITSSIGENKCEIMLCNENGMLITSPAFSILVYGKVNAHGSILNPDSEASTKLIKLLEEKTKNAVDKHFEDNPINEITEEQKAMLDKLSVDENGNLLYNGKSLTDRPYKSFTIDQGETYTIATNSNTGVFVFGMSVPDDAVNADIKRVRIMLNDYADWIDINDISVVTCDFISTIINKLTYYNDYSAYMLFCLDTISHTNDIIGNIIVSNYSQIEIEYYI